MKLVNEADLVDILDSALTVIENTVAILDCKDCANNYPPFERCDHCIVQFQVINNYVSKDE